MQLLALKLFSVPLWNFEDLKNDLFSFADNLIEPEIQPSKTPYFLLGTGPPVKPWCSASYTVGNWSGNDL